MTKDQILGWFDDLEKRKVTGQGHVTRHGFSQDAGAWIIELRTLLRSVFPAGHHVLKEVEQTSGPGMQVDYFQLFNAINGAFIAGRRLVQDGRLGSFADTIRAVTEDEFLEVADLLLSEGWRAPAAVIAGGVLEVHLRRLCEKNSLPLLSGAPSINKYNTAVAQARNAGQSIYESADGSQITAWGTLRNDAAHAPNTFNADSQRVKAMIDGIRNFVARTT